MHLHFPVTNQGNHTIDIIEDQSTSPRKNRQSKRSISTSRRLIQNLQYDTKLFDKVDSRIRGYLEKNQVNYEKTLVKMYKLDALKSEKAQRMLRELNQSKRQHFSAVRPAKNNIERNNSLPSSKQMKKDLVAIQKELKKINPEIQPQVQMNVSTFKFNQSNETRLNGGEWERVALQLNKIKPRMTNFDQEMDRLNQYYARNENSLNQLLQVQKDLMSYQLK